MSSKREISQVDERRSRDSRNSAVVSSESSTRKTTKPIAATPDLDEFVQDLLVTDKIILDHLAK
ncbi:MAG: hypothetical protein ABS40_08405 [Agrobacterium sp. SCN 61-19]|nr:MAG: hypothetical protein ABS40_08405 [Agrobacterium sp. SCN 61-19]